MVDAALGVDLGLVLAGDVGELGADEDVEVVVGRMAARVALGADGGAEDDEILGDAFLCGWEFGVSDESRKNDEVGTCTSPGEKERNILAWMRYMAPIAPPALLKIHSSSRLTWAPVAASPCSSSTM